MLANYSRFGKQRKSHEKTFNQFYQPENNINNANANNGKNLFGLGLFLAYSQFGIIVSLIEKTIVLWHNHNELYTV